MEKKIHIKWGENSYEMFVDSDLSNGILFDTEDQIDSFFQQLLVEKRNDGKAKVCLAKKRYDLEVEDTLDKNLHFKHIELPQLQRYHELYPTLHFGEKIKKYSNDEKSLARILYASVKTEIIFIDGLYDLLNMESCVALREQILEIQKKEEVVIIQILSHQVQGRYCDNLLAISMDGSGIVPLKQVEQKKEEETVIDESLEFMHDSSKEEDNEAI